PWPHVLYGGRRRILLALHGTTNRPETKSRRPQKLPLRARLGAKDEPSSSPLTGITRVQFWARRRINELSGYQKKKPPGPRHSRCEGRPQAKSRFTCSCAGGRPGARTTR